MKTLTAIVAVIALTAPGAAALEVTTARDARNTMIPFEIKLDATDAAMQAAYNDLIAKFNTLQSQHTAFKNSVTNCAKQGKLYNGSACANPTGMVPAGTVAMFKKGCPTGWVRDSAWDGRYPRGASSYGGAGGSTSAKLSTSHLPKHRHSFRGQKARLVRSANGDKHATIGVFTADMGSNGATFHSEYEGGGSSFSIQNPYRNTVFCRKQ